MNSSGTEAKIVYMGAHYGDHRDDCDARAAVVEVAEGVFESGYLSHGKFVPSGEHTYTLELAAKHSESFTELRCGPAPESGLFDGEHETSLEPVGRALWNQVTGAKRLIEAGSREQFYNSAGDEIEAQRQRSDEAARAGLKRQLGIV